MTPATKREKAPEALVLQSPVPFGTPSAWLFLVRVHACRAGLRFTRRKDYRYFALDGISKTFHGGCDATTLNQGRPVRSVRSRTEARGDERYKRAARHRNVWDSDPVMHAYATSPDLVRLDYTTAR